MTAKVGKKAVHSSNTNLHDHDPAVWQAWLRCSSKTALQHGMLVYDTANCVSMHNMTSASSCYLAPCLPAHRATASINQFLHSIGFMSCCTWKLCLCMGKSLWCMLILYPRLLRGPPTCSRMSICRLHQGTEAGFAMEASQWQWSRLLYAPGSAVCMKHFQRRPSHACNDDAQLYQK